MKDIEIYRNKVKKFAMLLLKYNIKATDLAFITKYFTIAELEETAVFIDSKKRNEKDEIIYNWHLPYGIIEIPKAIVGEDGMVRIENYYRALLFNMIECVNISCPPEEPIVKYFHMVKISDLVFSQTIDRK